MYTSVLSLISLAPTAFLVAASPCPPAQANARAIYTITNEGDNAVLAIPIMADGSIGALESGSRTATSGQGAAGIDGMTNQPAAPDPLFSQSALTINGNTLFAVNPGSNSLTMFMIDEADPTKLTMVCEPALLPGEFPNTVAATDSVVCVGFTGAKAGVSCLNYSEQGMGEADGLRPFNLGQSTPPVGPTNTVSQVFFSEDDSTLFSTVKGDPAVNKTGFLAAFPVTDGAVSQDIIMSSPEGTAVLFGSAAIPGTGQLFVTDASFGGAVLDIDGGDKATVAGMAEIEGQMATCWVSINPATNTAFVTDVLVNRLVEQSVTDASILGEIDLSANGGPGLIDLTSGGRFLYALNPGNGSTLASVTVVDAVTKEQVQHVAIDSLGAGKFTSGMVSVM